MNKPTNLFVIAALIAVGMSLGPTNALAEAKPGTVENKTRRQLAVLSQGQIRKELIGPPLKGNYSNGNPWDETYFRDGTIKYRDLKNNWQGKWSFRGRGFCTFYNQEKNGACWIILKTSANCYEFYPLSSFGLPNQEYSGLKQNWSAQGWRTTAASTCDVGVGV